MKKRFIVIPLTLASIISLSACEQEQDAPVNSRDKTAATLMNMPDGFSNVAHKCDGPNMVYTVFHGDSSYGSVAVAPNDPRCKTATSLPADTSVGS